MFFFSLHPAGVTAEEQMFLVTPKSVQVKAGDDVFFRCVVRNQQGNAQWTKDGFALGKWSFK